MSRVGRHAEALGHLGRALALSAVLAGALAAAPAKRSTPDSAKTAGEAFFAYDVPPRAIKIFAPDYPSEAKRARIEGTVHVRMTISETGRVIDTSILRSDTTPALEAAALHAAKISLFRPALMAGRPVKARLVFPFPFQVQ